MRFPSPTRTLKPVLRTGLRLCPFGLQRKLVEALLLNVFREAIEDGEFEFLEGRCIALEVTDLHYRLQLSYRNGRLIAEPPHRQADVCVRGDSAAFFQLAARREDPDTLFFRRRLCLEGDTELGLAVKNLFDSIELDTLPVWVQRGLKVAERLQSA